MMRFPAPLIPATLAKRYKRFLADVVMPNGETITAHVANPGAMLGIAATGSRVWLSKSDNPSRKLAYSWELIEVDLGQGPELVLAASGQDRIRHEHQVIAHFHTSLLDDGRNGPNQVLIRAHASGDAIQDDADTLLCHSC